VEIYLGQNLVGFGFSSKRNAQIKSVRIVWGSSETHAFRQSGLSNQAGNRILTLTRELLALLNPGLFVFARIWNKSASSVEFHKFIVLFMNGQAVLTEGNNDHSNRGTPH
jgi:hypothetical protein